MSPQTITWSITYAAAALAIGPPGLSGAGALVAVGDDLKIAAKWVAPFEVAQVGRTGPYWTLGGVVSEVSEIMRVRRAAGPLFVRFTDDPLRQIPDKLTGQVGFAIRADETVPAPLVRRHRPGEWVAFAVIEGRLPDPRRDYPRIQEWAKAHNQTPAGPITEVYHLHSGDGVSQRSRVEVQVVLEANWDATPATDDAGDPPPVAADRDECPPLPSPEPVPVPEPAARIRDALAKEDYDTVAEWILPSPGTLTLSQRQWLNRFALRVEAAARGMKSLYPQAADRFVALADLLADRQRELCEGARRSTAFDSGGTVDPSWEGNATEGRKVMQGIDRLLGRIAYRALEPEQAWSELSDLLGRAYDLILQKQNNQP